MVIKNNQPLVRVALTDAVPKLLRVALTPPVRPELLRVALTAGVLAENLEVALTQVHVHIYVGKIFVTKAFNICFLMKKNQAFLFD